jgi:hypothetical protein
MQRVTCVSRRLRAARSIERQMTAAAPAATRIRVPNSGIGRQSLPSRPRLTPPLPKTTPTRHTHHILHLLRGVLDATMFDAVVPKRTPINASCTCRGAFATTTFGSRLLLARAPHGATHRPSHHADVRVQEALMGVQKKPRPPWLSSGLETPHPQL